jgi:hypothetical protein
MATVPPPGAPGRPRDPSDRWPWVALIVGLVVVLVGIGFFLFNRSQAVTISVEGTPTANPVARAGTVSPGPPPTLVPPTLAASATLAPTPTPQPSPTATPAQPTPTPRPTQPPPTPPPAAPASPGPAGAQGGQPAPAAAPAAPAGQAVPAGTAQAAPAGAPAGAAGAQAGQPTSGSSQTAQPTAPSPTPFAGQVAKPGGLGNTRTDFDSAYGPPAGQRPDRLVVYRKNNFEYDVQFVPDINGRASAVVVRPQQGSQALPLEQAQAEAHKLLPQDAQPPSPTPEGNPQFVVERFTSQTLPAALPPDTVSATSGDPGAFLIVYAKDQQGRITRFVIGPGNDPNALMNLGR